MFFALLISAAVLVYMERKVAAFVQQRYGPYLVGPRGLLQPLADIVKLMFKEELRPKAADTLLFYAAPILSRHGGVRRVRGRAVRRRRRRSSGCSTSRFNWPSPTSTSACW